jgi:hypothetical protein
MKEATVGYVANQTGGFEACHWGWAPAGGGVGCYLQWEHKKLCFKLSVKDRGAIATARSRAVDFLRDRRLGKVEVRRPARLGAGLTMTVGVVDGLPVQEASGSWEELVNAMAEATRLSKALAEHLRAESEHAGADAKQAGPVG